MNFIWHYSFSILHNDTGDKHSHTSLAKPIYHLLDKNFRAKPIKTKAVFSSISARSFFLMHVVDWLISCFNSFSSFGGTLFVFSNQRCYFRECMRKTLTLITGIFMTAVVTVTLVQFLCLIWQRVFDTVVSNTLAIFLGAMSETILFQVSTASHNIFHQYFQFFVLFWLANRNQLIKGIWAIRCHII